MKRSCFRCDAVTGSSPGRRQFCLWAGLLLILIGRPSNGRAEEPILSAGEVKRNILLPLPQSSFIPASDESLYERDIADDMASGSGSGSGELSPEPTPVVPPITPAIPTVYIEIYLRITLEDYLSQMKEIEDAIKTSLLAILLEDNTQPFTRQKVTSKDELIVQLNEEKSSDGDLTVVQVYVIDSVSGEQNIYTTEQLYNTLKSEFDKFATQLQNMTNIEVVRVNFVEDDGGQMNSTELRWWDIFLITIGCLAASTCPIIICLAVSYVSE